MTLAVRPLLSVPLTSPLTEELVRIWSFVEGRWKPGRAITFWHDKPEEAVLLTESVRLLLTRSELSYAFPAGCDPNRHPLYLQEQTAIALKEVSYALKQCGYHLHTKLSLSGEAGEAIREEVNEALDAILRALDWVEAIR